MPVKRPYPLFVPSVSKMTQALYLLQEVVYKLVLSHCRSPVLIGTVVHWLPSIIAIVSIMDKLVFSIEEWVVLVNTTYSALYPHISEAATSQCFA